MYIEFVGIPGAGKTTLVEETRKLLEQAGVSCTTRATFFPENRKWLHKLFWSLLHPHYLDLYALLLWLRLAYRRRMGLEKTATRVHEYQKLRYQLAHTKKKSVFVWDNGFVQWFSNHVIAGVLDEMAAVKFIKKQLPRDTFLVFIDTRVNVAMERMQEREARLRATKGIAGWEPSVVEKQEQREAFAEGQRVQEVLFNALAKLGVYTVRIDGTQPPTENAAIVCESIKKRI